VAESKAVTSEHFNWFALDFGIVITPDAFYRPVVGSETNNRYGAIVAPRLHH
jgi:hypothetical protein